MTLLSICIPTYNRADLLEYSLRNLRSLDAFNITYEIVIIDHASNDHTQKIVDAAKQEWGNIRSFKQQKQIPLERQFNAAMRAGNGKYTMFLADDDKILPGKIVAYINQLESNPDASALYAPWLAYDDSKNEVIHGYFNVPERKVFDKSDPIQMFNFMTSQQIFPEIGIFRTEDLHSIMHSHPEAPYTWFIMIYALLRKGNIIFETESFYLEVAVTKLEFKRESRINLDIALSHLDKFRAGVEIMLSRMMMDYGHEKLPDQFRSNLHEVLLKYLCSRLTVTYRRMLVSGNYIQAVECAQGVMLWNGKFDPNMLEISHGIYITAAIQAIANHIEEATWLTHVYIVGFQKAGELIEQLSEKYSIKTVDFQAVADLDVKSIPYPNHSLIVVKNKSNKDAFSLLIPRGNILSLEELAEFYQLIPARRQLGDI